jgi:flagellar biogenesis protein FliO
MLDFLFGEGQYGLRFVFAIIVVFALLALTAWLVRRFGADRLGGGGARGRQPRLAVIDAAPVDGRRRLLLIRRDNVEHLVMIGGPTDVLVEANIVRAAAPAREAPPARAPATDTLPRAVPLGESNLWPLQPQSEPRVEPLPPTAPRAEGAPRPELSAREAPPLRAERAEAAPRSPKAPATPNSSLEEQWTGEAEEPAPAALPALRASRADPLQGLAAELARAQGQPDQTDASRQRSRGGPATTTAALAGAAAEPPSNADPDQNLAEMASRLEAALRRPGKNEPRIGEATPARPTPGAPGPVPGFDDDEATAPAAAPAPMQLRAVPMEARVQRPDPRAATRRQVTLPAPKNPYGSLEQEMASLLGRPNKT